MARLARARSLAGQILASCPVHWRRRAQSSRHDDGRDAITWSRRSGEAPAGTITDPAWRIKPSWYLLTTDDKMIPPAAQRAMSERTGSTVTEVAASHSVYVSQPAAVAALIHEAATAVSTPK